MKPQVGSKPLFRKRDTTLIFCSRLMLEDQMTMKCVLFVQKLAIVSCKHTKLQNYSSL